MGDVWVFVEACCESLVEGWEVDFIDLDEFLYF